MTIAEYATHTGLADSTIRRRIKRGALPAHQVDGRWLIDVDTAAPEQSPSQSPNRDEQSPLVDQLQSEVAHLRDQLSAKDEQLSTRDRQIDQLNQLLAMTSAQNGELTKQLPAPRQPLLDQLRSTISRLTGSKQAHG